MELINPLNTKLNFSPSLVSKPNDKGDFRWSSTVPGKTYTWDNKQAAEELAHHPDLAWDLLVAGGLRCDPVTQPPAPCPSEMDDATPHRRRGSSAAKASSKLRFVCISDTHGSHDSITNLPDGDVLVHAGDFTNTGTSSEVESFVQWFSEQPHKHKILIAGNHDITMQPDFYAKSFRRFGHFAKYDCDAMRDLVTGNPAFHYLEDDTVEIEGLKIHGSPWQPEFCGWAFNLERGKTSQRVWETIPTDTDVLVVHGPPLGYGDKIHTGSRVGCLDLLREIQSRVRPSHVVYGHVHEGYGQTTDGTTTYVNASSVNHHYTPSHQPMCFDVPRR